LCILIRPLSDDDILLKLKFLEITTDLKDEESGWAVIPRVDNLINKDDDMGRKLAKLRV